MSWLPGASVAWVASGQAESVGTWCSRRYCLRRHSARCTSLPQPPLPADCEVYEFSWVAPLGRAVSSIGRAVGGTRERCVEIGEDRQIVVRIGQGAIGVVQLARCVRSLIRVLRAAIEGRQEHTHGDSQLDIDDIVDWAAA